ncbi:MAG: RluA family pseudouridine synthase [Chloroflexi bacterium]|nr:RluA family pseudouridine synthase [Chloroflexota bacterium]
MTTTTTLTVIESGARLDRYIAEHLRDLSRAAVQRLIADAHIRVDDIARKASYRVQVGETITVRVPPPEPATPRAEKIPLDILYEDDDLIVVNKPAGMIVHPAAGHRVGTLVNALLAHLTSPPTPPLLGEGRWGGVGGVERPGIVHRLDSETSGIIVVAKNDAAMRDLQAQFKSRRVHKTYLALVEGAVKPPRGKIDAPIGRDPKHRQKMAVRPIPPTPFPAREGGRGLGQRARESATVYRTLARLSSDQSLDSRGTSPLKRADAQSASADLNLDRRRINSAARALPNARGAYTLLQVEPQTGRTHQIRVHLAFLGFPVVADAIYGKKKNALGLTRQFLHAWKIAFTLPRDGRAVSFVAPLAEELREALANLGFSIADL